MQTAVQCSQAGNAYARCCIVQDGASTSGSRGPEEDEKVIEAAHIRGLLQQNTEEMRSIMRALNGEYIEPQAGGDLLRDGAGVLPTGTCIHLCCLLVVSDAYPPCLSHWQHLGSG